MLWNTVFFFIFVYECLGDVNLGKKAPLGMSWFSCRKEAKEDVEDYPFVYFIVFLEREE